MKFTILTLFPEIIDNYCKASIIFRAIRDNLIDISSINIRDFADNKHKRVDDYPYGGGDGMLIQAEPIFMAYQSIKKNLSDKCKVIFTSPVGKTFNNEMAKEFSKYDDIVILCGHYEGVDQRVLDKIITDYVSIGDYVLTGGEIPALAIIDATVRFVPKVLGNENSANMDSFNNALLEHPQYTRPYKWRDIAVPEVLISGHHENIRRWQRQQSLLNTLKYRPDLLEKANLNIQDKEFLDKLELGDIK